MCAAPALQEPGSTLHPGGLDKSRKGSTKLSGGESRSIGAVASSTTKSSAPVGEKNNQQRASSTSAASATTATAVSNGTANRPEGNPFEEEEWDEYPNEALVDNGEPGVPVRALYDYEGAEFDELSFKKGEFDS